MRTNLKVPFTEKDEAKKLGARWDAARKLWYVEDKEDMSPFARWLSAVSGTESVNVASSIQTPIKKNHSDGITIIGSKYVEHPRVCDCLPWDECEVCRTFALSN
jgi:hypothetical protein